MKKLLALTLALMLVLASAALAESASLLKLSDMEVSIATEGQEQVMNLEGLSAQIAVGAPEGVPTIEVDADDGSQELLCGVMQIVDGKALIDVKGMTKPIAAALPTQSLAGLGADPTAALGELFANAGGLTDAKLPAFKGVEIPKIDLISLGAMLGATVETDANGAQSASFSLPWDMLKQLLSMVTVMIPSEAAGQMGPLLDQVNAMLQGDNGFALEGKIGDDGETSELLLDLYPVSGAQTADTPAGGLYITSTLNADTAQLLLYQDGQSIPMAEFNLVSDPAAAKLAFTANLAGQVNLSLSLYPDEVNEGAQVVALEVTGNGQTISASVNYGEVSGMEFCDVAMDLAGQFAMSFHIDEQPAADGSKTGTLVAAMQNAAYGQTVQFSAQIAEEKGEFDFRDADSAADAYNAEAMSEAEREAIMADLNNALAPLVQYMNGITAQPAA